MGGDNADELDVLAEGAGSSEMGSQIQDLREEEEEEEKGCKVNLAGVVGIVIVQLAVEVCRLFFCFVTTHVLIYYSLRVALTRSSCSFSQQLPLLLFIPPSSIHTSLEASLISGHHRPRRYQ